MIDIECNDGGKEICAEVASRSMPSRFRAEKPAKDSNLGLLSYPGFPLRLSR
jgi:hypothetical protein